MAHELTHAEIETLLGAYAVDAVDPDEADAVEAHLGECPRCRAEVAEHREAATLLSFSGAPAPERVWARIASGLEETPPFEMARPVPIERGRTSRTRGTRRSGRSTRAAFASALAIAAAVITGLGVQVVRQDHRIDRLAAIADERGLDQAAAAAAVAPNARTVRLATGAGDHVADAVVLPDGRGYLVRADLPALGRDQTYQLWGVIGGQTISLGLLGNDPTISSFRAVGPLTALAITAERAGGAVAPTTAPVVHGTLI